MVGCEVLDVCVTDVGVTDTWVEVMWLTVVWHGPEWLVIPCAVELGRLTWIEGEWLGVAVRLAVGWLGDAA